MATSVATPPASRIEAAVLTARGLLQQGNYAGALELAEKLLGEVPENRDVLYLVAVSQRYLGRIRQALETLARFERSHPVHSRLFQERGHCQRAARRHQCRHSRLPPRGGAEPRLAGQLAGTRTA